MIRCDGCNRHIFAREAACPFCAAPRNRVRGRLIAAGLLALSGCPSTGVAIYGGPPDDDPDAKVSTDAQVADAAPTDAALTDAALTDAMASDAALTDAMASDATLTDAAPADMAVEVDMPIAVPPYGVPPPDMTPTDAAPADAAPADATPADAQVDMFIALPPYGIPPEPERDPE